MFSARKLAAAALRGTAAAARSAGAAYERQLELRPRLTKALTAAAIGACGDVACQALQQAPAAGTLAAKPGAQIDGSRTLAFAAFNLLITPLVHEWYLALSAVSSPFSKMLLDQIVWAPVGTAAFLFYVALLERSSSASTYVLDKLGDVLLANWAIWPAIQLANFSLVPVRFQVLVVGLASFFWSLFLSSVAFPKGK